MVRSFLAVTALALAFGLAAPAIADDDCGLEHPDVALSVGPVPVKARASEGVWNVPAVRRDRPSRRFSTVAHDVDGALSGKTVYVSAGHGWTWRDTGAWRTQRGNTHDLVEDFISAETVAHYLIRYLQNMGAYVVPVRESDLNSELLIVDDVDAAVSVGTSDEAMGFGVLPTPITDQSNPFAAGSSLVLQASTEATGEVTWALDVPADGAYNVYIGYVQDPSRASDAHYVVRHPGGEAHFRVDQRRHGSTWVLLGRFYFYAGASGEIALLDDSADAGATLSADAVRIGGGVGRIDRGGGANGRPMFENNARYAAQLNGAPTSVYDYSSGDGNDDVGTRSRFSAWDHEDGEDAVYIAWHTNAPTPARGTSSFAYGPSNFGPLSEFSGVPGSLELMDAVHTELVSDFRASWEEDWQDRNQHTAYFGEVNPNHNPEMPAALFEIAFHDTAEDADALRDPRFRAIAARAMAHGVARYFATRDGVELTLPPEPVSDVRALQAADGQLEIAWRPPIPDVAGGDSASSYRVYLSRDGLAFDEGRDVQGSSYAFDPPEGNGPVYARVTATNAGGESLPSRVVGTRRAPADAAQVLIVAGFDRLDRAMLIDDDLSDYTIGNIERGFIERINDGSHVARFGAAIDAAGISFDTATAAAIGMQDVDIAAYPAVVWFLGEESSCCDPLAESERLAITSYLEAGGNLFISGSELAWTLGDQGDADDAAFLSDVLGLTYVADDADTYGFRGTGDAFAGVALDFADGGHGGYDADFPDVLAPVIGAVEVLAYDNDAGAAMVHLRDDEAGNQVFTAGFPFETITGADARADLMARILGEFGLEPDPVEDGGGGGDLFGGCGCRTGGPDLPTGVLIIAGLALLLRRRRRA
jgi:MYXO-CTERM domain-containing protein